MREILETGLPALGVDVSCISGLEKFSTMLLEKNQVMNLTAITEPAQVATLHLLDSLAVLLGADFAGKTVVDVGTGAGFPGMPLAIARRDVSVTLLDSLGKRVKFLEEVREALDLQNVACVHFFHGAHDADARFLVAVQKRPLYGGRAAVFRQQGGMDVYHPEWEKGEESLGQNLPESRGDAEVGRERRHRFASVARNFVELQHGDPELCRLDFEW